MLRAMKEQLKILALDEDKRFNLLFGAGIDYTTSKTSWLDFGSGEQTHFNSDIEANFKDAVASMDFMPTWISKTPVSEKKYHLLASLGYGLAEEEAHDVYSKKQIIPKTAIRYLEPALGAGFDHRTKVMKYSRNGDFPAWYELRGDIKLAGQFGDYKTLRTEGEIIQFYPITKNSDLVVFGSILARLMGIRPEDVHGNGNTRYDWRAGIGLRISKF